MLVWTSPTKSSNLPHRTAVSLKEAMAVKNTEKFETGFDKGEAVEKAGGLEIPQKGEILKGEALKAQEKCGSTTEPSNLLLEKP